jgi:hypothetical protein
MLGWLSAVKVVCCRCRRRFRTTCGVIIRCVLQVACENRIHFEVPRRLRNADTRVNVKVNTPV